MLLFRNDESKTSLSFMQHPEAHRTQLLQALEDARKSQAGTGLRAMCNVGSGLNTPLTDCRRIGK